jgi:hypothetical protein
MFVDASTYVFVATAFVRILEFIKSKELDEGVSARGKTESLYCCNTYYGEIQSSTKKTETVSHLELAACVVCTRLGFTVAHALYLDKNTIIF